MTQATAERQVDRPQRPLSEWGLCVAKRVSEWQRAYVKRVPVALATLARLRRGVGREPGDVPDLWQYTLDGLPEQPGVGDAATRQERAVHTALTLFALHQQSRAEHMHTPGRSLGTAVRRLARRAGSEVAVRRRFEALGTAETFSEVVHHARGLITQLRTHRIPLDYGAFTDDLIRLQTRAAHQVRLQWGRDYYRAVPETDADSDDNQTDLSVASAATSEGE